MATTVVDDDTGTEYCTGTDKETFEYYTEVESASIGSTTAPKCTAHDDHLMSYNTHQPTPLPSVHNENCENTRTASSFNTHPLPCSHEPNHVAEKWMWAEQTLNGCPKTPVTILGSFGAHALRCLAVLAPRNAAPGCASRMLGTGTQMSDNTGLTDFSTGITGGGTTPAIWLSNNNSSVMHVHTGTCAGTSAPPQQQGRYMKDRVQEVDRIVDLLAEAQSSAVLNSPAHLQHRFVESLISQALLATQKRLDTPIESLPMPPSTAEASVQTAATGVPCRSPRQPSSTFQQPKSPFNTTVITIGGTPIRKPNTGTRLGHSKSRAGTPQRTVQGYNNDTAGTQSGRPRVAHKSIGGSTGRQIGTSSRPLSRGDFQQTVVKKQGGDNINNKDWNNNRSNGAVLGPVVDDEICCHDGEVTVVVPANCTETRFADSSNNTVGVTKVKNTTNKNNICDGVFVLSDSTTGTALPLSPVVALQPVELKSVDVNKTSPPENVVVIESINSDTAANYRDCTGGSSTGTDITAVDRLDAVVEHISRSSDNNGDEFVHTTGMRRLSGSKRSLDIATELALAAERGDRDALDRLIFAIQRNVPPVQRNVPPLQRNVPPVHRDASPVPVGSTEIDSSSELPDDVELDLRNRRRGGRRPPPTGTTKTSTKHITNIQYDTESTISKSTALSTKIENATGSTRLVGVSSRSCTRAASRGDSSTGTDTGTIAPPLSSRRSRAVSQNSTTSNKSDVKNEYTGPDTGEQTNTEESTAVAKGPPRRKKGITGGVPAVVEKTVATNAATRAAPKSTAKRVLKRRKVADETPASDDNVLNNSKRTETKIEGSEVCTGAGTPPRAATRSKPRSKSGVAATPIAPVPTRREVKAGGTPLKARLRRRRA